MSTVLILTASAAFAQPFDAWLQNTGGSSYIQIPNSPAFNFAGKSFTFEAWIAVNGSGCTSLAGNNWTTNQWIGICNNTLRSYVRGDNSLFDAGHVPSNDWTHVAVTFDAATNRRTHYVDGEQVGTQVDEGPLVASSAAWRIFSDFAYEYTPVGSIDEVRFWNVARTRDQIRSTITQTLTTAQTGLIARYGLDASPSDSIGTAHGSKVGTSANYINGAITSGCTTNSSQLCVGPLGRFAVTATYRTSTTSGNASVVPYTTSESGMFTFFSPTNWEAVVKVLNGCGVNNRWWVFAGGLTDQHTEIAVTDLQHGVTKRYFNYAGTPFQPLNDVTAFATCP